jgi:large subunit ribosomal protein L4e
MKAKVLSLEGQPVSEIELPPVFETEFRPDVIRRAVLSAQSARLQPFGTDRMSGKRTSAETWGKGFGVSRTRRVKGTRYHAAGRGALSPHTVGGRRAHPPKVEKIIRERINRKERWLAMKSAIAATRNKRLVSSRGHILDGVPELPLIVVDEIEGKSKFREIKEIFQKIGLWNDVKRVISSKKLRPGRGKMRGRKYRQAVGPLIVIERDRGIVKGSRNTPGVDISTVFGLDVESLAPGGAPGRLTLWTQSAIQKLGEGIPLSPPPPEKEKLYFRIPAEEKLRFRVVQAPAPPEEKPPEEKPPEEKPPEEKPPEEKPPEEKPPEEKPPTPPEEKPPEEAVPPPEKSSEEVAPAPPEEKPPEEKPSEEKPPREMLQEKHPLSAEEEASSR